MGGVQLIVQAKSGPALRTAPESGPAFAGPAGPSMPPLHNYCLGVTVVYASRWFYYLVTCASSRQWPAGIMFYLPALKLF